ncbi:MAG TPA: MaoC family dehydratase [Pararhizobium sp.]|nr:MaoC family dehydratase [Pararhizobium sp.]
MVEHSGPKYAYEDFYLDRVFPLGPRIVTAEEIVEFAREFDPQPMHLDEEAGRASLLGGLAASGWHMTAMLMRMMAESYILESTSEGAPGVDRTEWKRPLLAGDSFGGTSTVIARRLSASRKGIGLVTLRHEMQNQRGETVMISGNVGMLALRHPEAVQ